jgi:diaminohydroxyphosphoribosylaminopyrimidine deaminase / 5-amino-6-(5-phosphoribosylamino)uracil reductase
VVRGAEEADIGFMRRAFQLAESGLGLAAPNPMVGAVVVSDGRVVGQGWHEGPGTPHAEIVALREAGDRARGATLYVTLEPCSHHGRTGPCAPAVAGSGVARVVAAIQDPNPQVDGSGFELLRRAGIMVDVGICRSEGEELILGFATRMRTGRPHVTLKMAASLDGKIPARDGSSTWITGEEARRDAHRMRAGSGAVIVGAGTAISDRPHLTVRLEGYRGRQPLRVVADSSGRTPPDGPLFDGSAPTLIATSRRVPDEVRRAWVERGARVVAVGDESVRVSALLEYLGDEGIQEALIEGGQTLAWSAVEEGSIDRLVLYIAPKLIGGESAPGVIGGKGFDSLAEALLMDITRVERLGPDLKVVADVHRDR